MPATDDYLRNLKLMHRVFCGSAVLLLGTTLWMMWADYDDEWRTYQRQAFTYQAERLKARENAVSASPDYKEKVSELAQRIQAADVELVKQHVEVEKLANQVKAAVGKTSNHLRSLKTERARRDVARANYNLAIRDELVGQDLAKREQAYQTIEASVQTMEVQFGELKFQENLAKGDLTKVTGVRDMSQKELKGVETQSVLIHAALNKIEPDTWLSKTKRQMMLLPIIDGFNSPERITQDWMPKLQFGLGGMGTVSRFDRCRTCHAMIDTVDDTVKTSVVGAFPHGTAQDRRFAHPYASHPRLDVYLGATSPHPLPKFGCTVCHEGQGSGTSFTNASHTPNDPTQADDWAEHHKWSDNHFWERPMAPTRFKESSCIKCHVNITELAVNEKYGPTAPKVARGHDLVKTYGCFGCHEIQGYEGSKIIGPDLRLEPSTPEEAAEIANDPTMVAGKMRKVGPSLRHLASKAEAGFVASWTEEPKRFRPTTRMPQFFKLENQQDVHGQQYNPVEIAAMTHYLLSKSSSYEQLTPAVDYVPDAKRGQELFATKGCVACHTHEAVPGLDAVFGPELSKIHAKLKAGQQGFNWLYTWIREPERYHPRTKMPHLFLDAEGTGEKRIDPAADIAAFLLKLEGAPVDFKPTADYETPVVTDQLLDELVSHFLGKSLTKSQIAQFMESGQYPIAIDRIKGDEIELVGQNTGELNATEWKNRKLTYLGRKSISRYGCYGCHDIPNFEQARPIGTALQDWGKKDRSRLAFEHIHEYLNHHGQAGFGITVSSLDDAAAKRLQIEHTSGVRVTNSKGKTLVVDDVVTSLDGVGVTDVDQYHDRLDRTIVGSDVAIGILRGGHDQTVTQHADSSLLERVEQGIGSAERKEFSEGGPTAERELSAAFYVENLLHHGRPGFLWQKLRQPRSYDYKMIETKPYDDRLKMPKFPFSEDDIDAIATFVLGLVVEPPAVEYMYNPTGVAGAKIRGEQLIEQFNCSGCHVLELPTIRYAADVDAITASDPSTDYPEAVALLKKLRPMTEGTTGETKAIKTTEGLKTLPIVEFHGMISGTPDPADPPEDQEYVVELWESLKVLGKELFPTYKFIFPAANLDKIEPARGGRYAEWLVQRLLDQSVAKERSLAWQMAPPPLDMEGTKVQTPWLFNFLRNPGKIRHTTVLRMPRFNMSDDEAKALANYFAAVGNAPFPYQLIEQREPAYLDAVNSDFHKVFPDKKNEYLTESWQMLNAPLCIKCHSVGGRQVTVSDPAKDIRGPNLELASERLKPDWLLLWLFRPSWITPYTSMPSPLPPQQAGGQPRYPELFDGEGLRQTVSLRDSLVNYYKLLEREVGTVDAQKSASRVDAGKGQQ
jgi:cytochrome c551/c552